ncbi:MAG: hypothetical protein IIT58_13905, partial [Treponema sp.]|nr:hypothetical protein [Treponema sp.]
TFDNFLCKFFISDFFWCHIAPKDEFMVIALNIIKKWDAGKTKLRGHLLVERQRKLRSRNGKQGDTLIFFPSLGPAF